MTLPALRIGEGWDTHQLVTGRPLVLGGTRRRTGRGAHVALTPMRFMIAHCCAIERVLFQLQ